ncbi:NicO-domain-containing protein [Phlegmacium glaucopus]|nr:NicO-domain-containing protein [Phlegmacium glaucopus]
MILPKLTLFGRSILLITCEISANVICWIVAGILFGKNADTRPVLSLALLAWTLGLRHALDADHISAIDNVTRGLIGLGQLPVTCGLFFSLGHSTIVIVIIVAIAISSHVYDKLHGVGNVGGIVGAAVSGSFLFIIGLANTVILWRIIKHKRQDKNRERRRENGEVIPDDVPRHPKENHMLMMRILGPIITFVNRPWKMYPVGVLFGLGFDTASSIALLAVSAIAKKGPNGKSIPNAQIIVLPLLFTAGMTLIDSSDSILMLYSYSGVPERPFLVFAPSGNSTMTKEHAVHDTSNDLVPESEQTPDDKGGNTEIDLQDNDQNGLPKEPPNPVQPITPGEHASDSSMARDMRVKMNVMSGLSIILTLMSILVAFSISLITIMSLIGQQCTSCVKAAEADGGHGGGLSGRWWRGWAKANDQSGYIGAAIVGGFLLVVVGWYGGRWAAKKLKGKFFLNSWGNYS